MTSANTALSAPADYPALEIEPGLWSFLPPTRKGGSC